MNIKTMNLAVGLVMIMVSAGLFTSCIREELPNMNVDITDVQPSVSGTGIVKTTIQENGVTLYADMSTTDPAHLNLDITVSKNAKWSYVDVKMDTTFIEYNGMKIYTPQSDQCKIDTTIVGEISAPTDFTVTRYIKVVSEAEGVNEDDTLTQYFINAKKSGFIGWEKDGVRSSQYVPGAHLYKIWTIDILPAGIPTTLTFDNWASITGTDFQQPYEMVEDNTGKTVRANIWSSTNASIALMAKTNPLVQYGAKTTSDVAPVRGSENKSALLLTSNDIRYTQTYARPFLAGCCFIGEFDGSDTGALTCTHVGLPFNKAPESLTFWYKYYPMPIIDPNTAPYSGFNVPGIEEYVGKQDRGYIRAVLYRADGDNQWLDGASIRDITDKDIIAYAEFAPEGLVSDYTKTTIPFTYINNYDATDLANWKYNLAIYFASSYNDFRFICGADMSEQVINHTGFGKQMGSMLYLDEMQINCK